MILYQYNVLTVIVLRMVCSFPLFRHRLDLSLKLLRNIDKHKVQRELLTLRWVIIGMRQEQHEREQKRCPIILESCLYLFRMQSLRYFYCLFRCNVHLFPRNKMLTARLSVLVFSRPTRWIVAWNSGLLSGLSFPNPWKPVSFVISTSNPWNDEREPCSHLALLPRALCPLERSRSANGPLF